MVKLLKSFSITRFVTHSLRHTKFLNNFKTYKETLQTWPPTLDLHNIVKVILIIWPLTFKVNKGILLKVIHGHLFISSKSATNAYVLC